MTDLAIILGNGFDLDMGLQSKYSNFVKSREWEAMVKRVEMFLLSEDYRNHSLIAQLQEASEKSQWFDVEEEIHKFISTHTDNSIQEIGEIRNEFNLIKEGLRKYLLRITENYKAKEDRLAYQLLAYLQQYPKSIVEINFNYTFPSTFLHSQVYYFHYSVTYVHGNIRDGDIVLGCDLHDGEKVNRQLSFMYKYNMLNKPNHIARILKNAKEIIIFGHSVNEMDFCYFRDLLKDLTSSPDPARHLTLFTYDEDSERGIKDNIRNQGISVSDLYNNLFTFSVIHTKGYYEGKPDELRKWHELLIRLLSANNSTN